MLALFVGLLGGCGAEPPTEVAQGDGGYGMDTGDANASSDSSEHRPEGGLPDAVVLDTGASDADATDTGAFDTGIEDSAVDSARPDSSQCLVRDRSGRPKLVIEHASFGVGNTWADDTAGFQSLVKNDWLYYHVYRTYIDMGDPAPGAEKTLQLSYRLDGTLQPEKTYHEGDIIYLNVPPQNLACCDWQLTSAKWGTDEASAIDVTKELKKYVLDCVLDFYCFSGNQLAGDPAPGAMKHLYLRYQLNGADKTFVCNEEGADNHIVVPQ